MRHFLVQQVNDNKYRELFSKNIRAWNRECLELLNNIQELHAESKKWMIAEFKRTSKIHQKGK